MLLKGKPVADEIINEIKLDYCHYRPTLALVRVGDNPDDIAYEKNIIKKAKEVGVNVQQTALISNEQIDYWELKAVLENIKNTDYIDGMLLFRPLPSNIEKVINSVKYSMSPNQDIDGLLSNSPFYPCTAMACYEILKYYNISIEGKNVVVIGRSETIGRPVADLLLNENATVTVCHSKTPNIKEYTLKADIVIVAVGKANMFNKSYFNENCTVIDVGINFDENGKMCGDVAAEVADKVANITPVPGGVGSVTTSVLMKNVYKARKGRIKE